MARVYIRYFRILVCQKAMAWIELQRSVWQCALHQRQAGATELAIRSKTIRKSRIQYAMLLSIMIVSLALSLLLYSGPYIFFDDTQYLAYVKNILIGKFSPFMGLFSIKFLMLYIWAAFVWLFGNNIFAIEMPQLVSMLSIIILTFFIGKSIKGPGFGLLSAAFAASSPIIVGYSTRVLPDLPAGALASLLLYMVIKKKAKQETRFLSLAAGVLGILMLAVKMESAIFVLALGLVLLLSRFLNTRKTSFSLKYASLGMLLGALILQSYLSLFSSGIIRWIRFYSSASAIAPATIHTQVLLLAAILNPYAFYGGLMGSGMSTYVYPLGLLIDFSILGSIFILARRKSSAQLKMLSVINLIVILYLSFGPRSITPYTINVLQDRFFTMIASPMCIVAAYSVIAAYGYIKKRSKPLAIGVCAAIIVYTMLSNAPVYFALHAQNSNNFMIASSYQKIINFVYKSNPNTTICCFDGINQYECSYLSCSYLSFIARSSTIAFRETNHCNSSIANNSFLVFTPCGKTEPRDWAGNNCSLENLSSISGHSAYLYKITHAP